MGLDRCTRTRLVTRCCHGAFFGFGFVLTFLTLAAMFWIAWCYFGLAIVQISDTQRRAIVNYSYTTSKPLPTPTTAAPSHSTTVATEETSINSISKLPTTDSILRGSSRGESQVKINKKKEAAVISSLAKGDFAERDRSTYNNSPSALPSKDASDFVISTPRGPPRNNEESHSSSSLPAAILTGSAAEDAEDRVYARRVLPPGTENRPEEEDESKDRSVRRNPPDSASVPRFDISPTKVYNTDARSESSRVDDPINRPTREEDRTPSRDYADRDKSEVPRRDDIQSSRRSDPEPVYREPDFERDYPRRYSTSSDRSRSTYDEIDDDRGSRSRYDKRDRGRVSDDRYPKGDTRVYPDDPDLVPPPRPLPNEDRYRARERYPDEIPRRGDDDRYDDRYRDYDDKSRSRDRDTRYRDPDRSPTRDDRYRDDERFRSRDEDRYRDRDRDDDRYTRLDVDDDRYTRRDDGGYRSRDDDRYRSRDDDRYRSRDDDRYRPRDDERYRNRDDRYNDERYRVREDDRYKTRDDDRYRSDEDRRDTVQRSRVEEDRYRSRTDEDKYVEPSRPRIRDLDIKDPVSRSSIALPDGDRKPPSSRSEYSARVEESAADYDRPARDRQRSPVRDDINPSRLSRPSYDEERYRDRDRGDDYRRPSGYEGEMRISPTRTRDDSSLSRSSLIDSRPKDIDDDSKYSENPRDRIRDDRYIDKDDRIPNTRIQNSRATDSSRESSRRYIDDGDRYRTRVPNERIGDPKTSGPREEVILDRRSYASEEDGEYRRGGSRTYNTYDDRTRSPTDDTRRKYRDDENYSRRDSLDEEDYKRSRPREVYDRDSDKSRDRYDDDRRRYDDRYTPRVEDRYSDRLPPLPVRKYDTYPDADEMPRRRDPEVSVIRKEDSREKDRGEKLTPISSSRSEDRLYDRDDSKSSRRRYDDDLSVSENRNFRDRDSDDRRYSGGSRTPVSSKEPVLGSSMSPVYSREPTAVVIREKRFQSTEDRYQNSRVYSDNTNNDRKFIDVEPKSRESMRPLNAKDVIEAAIRHSDTSDQNSRKVYYPVFDPRLSNLTSPEIIRPSERRGTTITVKRRRSA